MVIGYCALNSATIDAEPSLSYTVEENVHKSCGANFITKLNIAKTYYQVLLSKGMPLTVFPTHRSLMEFVTYIHLMRTVLANLSHVMYVF